MDGFSLPPKAPSNDFGESINADRFTLLMHQSHQGCRDPSNRRASPSETSMSPIERPWRVTVRSLRPYWSSSRQPAMSEKRSALSRACSRRFAAWPSCLSRAQRGGLSSGVSISAILIFSP